MTASGRGRGGRVPPVDPVGPGDGPVTTKILPFRYLVRDDRDGRSLRCVEAPNISVRLERGLSVPAASARRAPEGTVYLDGAAQGEPFLDAERRVYNLDHHEGCIRPFTVATCEQAMTLLLKGLDLRSGEWTVYANEPDFDTVLAVWLLLNHLRVVAKDGTVRGRILPVVRVEGVVDSHGLELVELTAFPDDLLRDTLATVDRLRARELELKRSGGWATADLLQYTAETLHDVDQLVYSPRDFDGLTEVEEVIRVPLTTDRIAVLCRSSVGVYEVERHLRRLYGDRVGLIVLEKDRSTYTLRQTDPFLPRSLDAVYERLNQLDPGTDRNNRWGGSADIGGSPRGRGTRLEPEEIATACGWVFRPPSSATRLRAVAGAAILGLGVLVGTVLTSLPPPALTLWRGALSLSDPATALLFGLQLAAFVALLGVFHPPPWRPARLGIRWPVDFGWAALLPAAAVAALVGGACLPGCLAGPAPPPVAAWLSLVVIVTAWEGLFRGLLHGRLVRHFAVQRPGGPWFLSAPTLVTALLSTVGTALLCLQPNWPLLGAPHLARFALGLTAAFLLGVAAGVARERSGSLLAAITLHAGGAFVAVLAGPLVG